MRTDGNVSLISVAYKLENSAVDSEPQIVPLQNLSCNEQRSSFTTATMSGSSLTSVSSAGSSDVGGGGSGDDNEYVGRQGQTPQKHLQKPWTLSDSGIVNSANMDDRLNMSDQDPSFGSVAVIGGGDFGRALSIRMAQSGIGVLLGSRDPESKRKLFGENVVQLMSVQKAILEASSGVVVMAIPKSFYSSTVAKLGGLLTDKVVIDVSNRTKAKAKSNISQAEYLQSLLPRSFVVKAFNVLSAYSLQSGGIQGSKEVYFAGDDRNAKSKVSELVRIMGFTPVDRGALMSASQIEDIPVMTFPSWKAPLIVSFVFFLIIFLLAWGKFQVCWTLTWDNRGWHFDRWNTIPATTLNSSLSIHALTLLALCYLPGVLAAYLQLIRGTKYSKFPMWLDRWLRMRKQLGLLMLFSATLHAIISMMTFSPVYNELAWGKPVKIRADVLKEVNWTYSETVPDQEVTVMGGSKMDWRGEAFVTSGAVAFMIAVVLGITSLPSVTASLSWKEFAFVQSKLGWLCLLFAMSHDMFYGWPYMDGPSCSIPSSFQYALYIPAITLGLKLPLLLPCVDLMLTRIRGGQDRQRWRLSNLRLKKNNSKADKAPEGFDPQAVVVVVADHTSDLNRVA